MLFRSKIFTGLSVKNQKKRLKLSLLVFLVALAIPLSYLVKIGYEQFQKDVYNYHLWNSKHVVNNTASDMKMHLRVENNRPIDDYQFYKVRRKSGDIDSSTTLSPLAVIPDETTIPGLVSYFQLDESGAFSCPLLPFNSTASDGSESVDHILSDSEIAERMSLRKQIQPILAASGFIPTKEGEKPADLMDAEGKPPHAKVDGAAYPVDITKISLFRSKRSDTGHVIFYRKIWNGENQLVQGFVVDEHAFLLDTLKENFQEAEFDTDVLLQVYYKNNHLSNFFYENQRDDSQEVSVVSADTNVKKISLKKLEFPSPLSNYDLVFSVDHLPLGDSTRTGAIFLTIVLFIIISGLVIFYRLGIQQINLNEERLNFVSSVSHELKTPLTSIIMYADMLRSGMLTDTTKCSEYYDFIFFEGERLGRLIGNVLRLSKLGQDRADISLEYVSLDAAVDILKSKTSTLIENNNFNLNINYESCEKNACEILIDRDAFTQVTINLIDNAVKFTTEYLSRTEDADSALARNIDINISKNIEQNSLLKFGIRDYGPGISRADEKHIFKSFYRAGNELTRKTTGTGMGLALVSELAQAMEGNVEFFNREPGAEFVINFQYRLLKS